MERRKTRLLLIGSLKPDVGGTVILFKLLLDWLRTEGPFEVEVIDSSGMREQGLAALGKYTRMCWNLGREGWRTDVISVHVMGTAVPYLIGPLLFVKYVLRKPVMLRLFGGWDFRGDAWPIRTLCLWFCRRVDSLVVETRLMAESLGKTCRRDVNVLFNNRRLPARQQEGPLKGPARRFLYLSHIRVEKGIHVLLEAAKHLPPAVSLDVYGPFFDGLDESIFARSTNVRYCGVAEPAQVPRILAEHDVLVLPSFFEHEGHPGIILEALSVGLPVISTNWRAIPEILDETCGLLVEPRNAAALIDAMQRLITDQGLYTRLSAGALIHSEQFSDLKWNERFVDFVSKIKQT